jgi:hypothetical protein
MTDPGSLLSTLAESAAAIVAIVGGFLVSRLVAISSERDGLKRQHQHARDQLSHATTEYDQAHEYRLRQSQRWFREQILDDLIGVKPEDVNRDELFANNIPRGSSEEELAPYLDELIERVRAATAAVVSHLRSTDDRRLGLKTLENRGMPVAETDREIYELVTDWVAEKLPSNSSPLSMAGMRLPRIRNAVAISTDMRRFDESLRDEHEQSARKRLLETEADRLQREVELAGRPSGVTPAIIILALYSLVGIVAPVVVIAISPKRLASWIVWVLVAAFVAGLVAVLGYMFWYARTLNDQLHVEARTGGN